MSVYTQSMGDLALKVDWVLAMIGLAYSFVMKWFGAVDHRRDRGPSGKSQGTRGRPDFGEHAECGYLWRENTIQSVAPESLVLKESQCIE